jgi:glucose/arabinose dehydrogenase
MIALGLRNPWRFSFDRKTGDMWIGDVGAGAQEEVDFRPKAQIGKLANYGWSRYEGTAAYWRTERLARKGKLIFPVWTYAHGDGSLCSVIGGFVYRGSTLPTARGRYFLGDFCAGTVWSFKVGPKGRASTPTALAQRLPNLTSFGEDGNGELYATTLDGALYELG